MRWIRQQQDAFTLIELVIALSILTLAIAGAVKLSGVGLTQLNQTRLHQQASYFAHGHLTSLMHTNRLTEGVHYGHYSNQFQWTLLISQIKNGKAFSADLTVSFDARSLQFHTLIFKPSSSNNEPALTPQEQSESASEARFRPQ